MRKGFQIFIFPITLLAASSVFQSCTITAEGFREDIEFDEVEFEIDDSFYSGTIKVSPVERERTGVRVGFHAETGKKNSEQQEKKGGKNNIQIYVQAFDEEFDEDYDGYGFGVGVSGVPPVSKINEDVDLILPARLGLNYFDGEADAGLIDPDLRYLEVEWDAGIGIDYHGLQPAVGFYMSNVVGVAEGFIGATPVDFDMEGNNAGLFLEVRYRGEEIPVVAGIRGMVGDVEKWLFSLGVVF